MRTPGLDAVARIRRYPDAHPFAKSRSQLPSPGLIPIVVVDHKILSRDTFTDPYLGQGMYTLTIRITRLP
jgi:hypothetical protein